VLSFILKIGQVMVDGGGFLENLEIHHFFVKNWKSTTFLWKIGNSPFFMKIWKFTFF
jgi:hypothetical protein